MKTYWHEKELSEVFEELHSSPLGLTADEARRRLLTAGPNELREKKRRSHFMMFLGQFRDFMILVLIAASIISGIIGEHIDTIAILVIVILNAVIGFVQEYRAEKAMEALKKMSTPSAETVRDGRPFSIHSAEIVPGDVVMLESGRIVPADMRITEAFVLRIDESALTGESVAVEKHTSSIPGGSIPLGDRKNLAYKGTVVVNGRGSGIVTATGMETELGKIAAMIQEEEVRTPLQKRLAHFGRRLALAVFALCAVIFLIGVMRGQEPVLMLLTAISLAVAAIPEALPAVVTISLALAARKMVSQNAIIRKLPAVETLGSVTYICSDKTGTLTLNRMTVEKVWIDGRVAGIGELQPRAANEVPGLTGTLDRLLLALALCNDVRVSGDGEVTGDPTEIALYRFARHMGYGKEDLETAFRRVGEIPFDAQRKAMTTVHAGNDGAVISFTKGAVETLISASTDMLTTGGIKAADASQIISASDRMSSEGLRVLAVAMKRWDRLPDALTPGSAESDLTFIGLVGLIDPPREETAGSVALCKSAGIRPVMITGDHPATAEAIARRLGILEDDSAAVMTGQELEGMPIAEFDEKVEGISVYARMAPEQKLKIIKALQDRGQFVAMTGDGVNDAPALRRADIGIAMGITGTDVSKEASHMILMDDNFATIVRAVKEGRRVFDNIRKFIKYTMTSNSGEIWTIFLAPFLGLPIPLLPVHILWINLVTDGLPGLALAAEPAEKGIMERPPRHPSESIFAHGLGAHIIWVGLLMGGVSLITQAWSLKTGSANWQTMVFTVLCLSQMGHVLAIRSESRSLFSQGLSSNRPLLGAFALTLVLQMATIYVPFLHPVFKTRPLSFHELVFTLAMSSVVFFAVETEKWIRRRRWQMS